MSMETTTWKKRWDKDYKQIQEELGVWGSTLGFAH